MVILEEAERRDILRKLKIIEKALPEVEELVKEGKFNKVPHKNMDVIDCLSRGIFSVNIKESTVIFRLCSQDLLEKKQTPD